MRVEIGSPEELLKHFIEVEKQVYSGNSFWSPKSIEEYAYLFSLEDPYLNRGERELVVCFNSEGQPVARCVVQFDNESARAFGKKTGFFSFFEALDQPDAAKLLFQTGFQWFLQREITHVVGPMSPKITDARGLLLEGEGTPTIGMPFNPVYYSRLLEGCGFKKMSDMYEFVITLSTSYKVIDLIAKKVQRTNQDLRVRYLESGQVEKDIQLISEMYNKAWRENSGFIPIQSEEMMYSTRPLLDQMQPDWVGFLEDNGKVMGFRFLVPNYNDLLKGEKIESYRAIFIGILPEYRNQGMDSLIFSDIIHNFCPKYGVKKIHIAWVVESNKKWIKELKRLGGKNTEIKSYRIFERSL